MRIHYTLPGLIPAESAPAETTNISKSPFRSRLKSVPAPQWVHWKQLLHLDDAPVNALSIGPPPKPYDTEARDAAEERLNWRRMLDRHVAAFDESEDPGADSPAIERMLTLLVGYRDMEDSIAARHLAEAEG